MKIDEIVEMEPQISEPRFGAEPSIRKLIEQYYAPHFPDNYKEMAQEYIDKLKEMLTGGNHG